MKKGDIVETTADTVSTFGEQPVPAGTKATVAEVFPGKGIMADVTFRDQTETDPGDHDQVALLDGQYKEI